MELWVATTNQGKLNEFRNISGDQHELHSVSELRSYAAPPEPGKPLRTMRGLKLEP